MQPKSKFRFLLGDEVQDWNGLQQEIAAKLLHPEGRAILVGDPSQSIYGFMGADANSFYNLTERFNAQSLELNICYRCGTTHIELAQNLVPSIEAAPNAIAGTIEYKNLLKDIGMMQAGSMVICRLNAPLLSAYFSLIIAETPAIILGRSIGKHLISIVDKVAEAPGFRYVDLGKRLAEYLKAEKERLEQRPNTENKIAELLDSIECLQLCATNFNCYDLDTFKQKLENLFVDATDRQYSPKDVVTLCTVHKAKGLEADHIGIIQQRPKRTSNGVEWNDIMPMVFSKQRDWEKKQERNIQYVAWTRAKQSLTFFGSYSADETPDVIRDDGFDPFNDLEEGDNFMPDEPTLEKILEEGHRHLVGVEANLRATINDIEADDDYSFCLESARNDAEKHFQWRKSNLERLTIENLEPIVGNSNALTIREQTIRPMIDAIYSASPDKHKEAVQFALSETQRLRHSFAKSEPAEQTDVDDNHATIEPDNSPYVVVEDAIESPAGIPIPPREEPESPIDESTQSETDKNDAIEIPPAPTHPVDWAKWVLENAFDADGNPQIVILDTETTDWASNKNNCEVVQIGIIDLKGNVLFNEYIKPLKSTITEGAYSAHKISDAVLAEHNATTLFTHVDNIFAAIQNRYVIAYNSPFDKDALENAFQLNALLMPDVNGWMCAIRKYAVHNDWNSNSHKSRGSWWKLTEALEQERIQPDENAHDALADVQMTRQLIAKMATNDPNKWRNSIGYDIGETVNVKATNFLMQVVKTMPNGEVNLKGVIDKTLADTMRATAIERPEFSTPKVSPAVAEIVIDDESTATEPVADTVNEISVDNLPTDKHEADTESPMVQVEANTPPEKAKSLDPYERIKQIFQRLSVNEAVELRDLLNEVISEKTELTQ